MNIWKIFVCEISCEFFVCVKFVCERFFVCRYVRTLVYLQPYHRVVNEEDIHHTCMLLMC